MTGPVSSRETGIRVEVRSAADVCNIVDQVDQGAVGELVMRSRGDSREIRGVVFVESGRVCWAMARGLARRLTELLVSRSKGTDARSMEDLFRRCREEGAPLGEFLVARGVVEPGELRTVLLEHTAESLDVLCNTDVEVGWCVRPGPGYSPRFTFSTSELLAHLVRRGLGASDSPLYADVDGLSTLLANELAPGEWGAAFVRGASAAPSPFVVHGDLPPHTRELLRVGKWAASALDLASTFQDSGAFVTVAAPDESARAGDVYVAWRHRDETGGAIIAGRMHAHGPARILNRRARTRRTSR